MTPPEGATTPELETSGAIDTRPAPPPDYLVEPLLEVIHAPERASITVVEDTFVFATAADYRRVVMSGMVLMLFAGVLGVLILGGGVFNGGNNNGSLRSVGAPLAHSRSVIASMATDASAGDRCQVVEGVVFVDTLPNGVLGADEVGVEGVEVTIRDLRGRLVGEVLTDGDGAYAYDVRTPQLVTVSIPLLQDEGYWHGGGLLQTAGSQTLVGADGCRTDHPVQPLVRLEGPQTPPRTIPPAAVVPPVEGAGSGDGIELQGRVWIDQNGDQTFEASELGWGAATVTLRDGSGEVVASAETGTTGLYSFSNLTANTDYVVDVVTTGSFRSANAFGVRLPGTTEPRVGVRTGDPLLAVWGVDFAFLR